MRNRRERSPSEPERWEVLAAARRQQAGGWVRTRTGTRRSSVNPERQARPVVVRRFPPGTNRPLGEGHDPAGEAVAGKPHGGFGER